MKVLLLNTIPWLIEGIILGLFFPIIFLIPFIFYIKSLKTTLLEVSPENRLIKPYFLWALLIPIWSTLYNFYVVSKIADSLRLELKSRNIPVNSRRPTYLKGLIMSLFLCLGASPFFFLHLINMYVMYVQIPSFIVNFFLHLCTTSLVAPLFWIVYWANVLHYKKLLRKDNVEYTSRTFEITELNEKL